MPRALARSLAVVALLPAAAWADRPDEHWLPYGLLDRVQIAPPRVSATTELGSHNGFETAGLTLHAMASTDCMCRMGIYGTLPITFALSEPIGLMAAGVATPRQPARSAFGTADLGLFIGTDERQSQQIYRIGALLPTAPAGGHPQLASARVGDMALELPRSAGLRLSSARELGWMHVPSRWIVPGIVSALRVDTGVDLALELDHPAGKQMHVIPRAGAGMLFTRHRGTVSIDTAIALDPTDDAQLNLRWSAGVTGRIVRPDGSGGWFSPALTVAVLRTPESWGMTFAVDVMATGHRKQKGTAYDGYSIAE